MNRNEPCHCGSGDKYKRCCQVSDKKVLPKSTRLILLALLPIALGGTVWSLIHRGDSESETSSRFATSGQSSDTTNATTPDANPVGVPGPQPDGPVPEGKAWSTEHGHWHDASPVQVQASGSQKLSATDPGQTPPPPPVDGEERNGQVYSAEHGHWHTASGSAASTSTPRPGAGPRPLVSVRPDGTVTSSTLEPQPPGPAPEGKVWAAEHGHWHDKPAFPSGQPDPDSGGN